MRKVNIPEFRKEVIAIIEKNRKKVISLETKIDSSTITFRGKNYVCEITLNDKWIGYDLEIDVPKGYVSCGRQNDTDLYPIYSSANEEAAIDVYHDLIRTIQAIFNDDLYYMTTPEYAYTARKNQDGTYSIGYMKRKKFMFLNYASGWRDDVYSAAEFEKLDANLLF